MSRFDWRYELRNIYDGVREGLYEPVGQILPWYVYDPTLTAVDPIYDVGGVPAGRRWLDPVNLTVASAVKVEGGAPANDNGLYVVSTLKLVFTVDAARHAGIADIVFNPEGHNVDRVIYESKVFEPTQVRTRGMLKAGYAVIGVDLAQVKSEELVNDPQFQQYCTDAPMGGTQQGTFSTTMMEGF